MKQQSTIILLILCFLLGGIYMFQKQHYTDMFTEEQTHFITFRPSDISKIVLSKHTEKEVQTFIKKDNQWYIQGTPDKKANQQRVEEILDQAQNIMIGKPISESAEKLTVFQLDDEAGTKVELWKENEPITFYVGKISDTDYKHTFVRYAKDEKAYKAQEAFEGVFNTPLSSFKNKELVNVSLDDIDTIVLKKGNKKTSFVKKDRVWKQEEITIQRSTEQIESLLKDLASFNIAQFITTNDISQEQIKKQEFAKIYLHLSKTGADAITINIATINKKWYAYISHTQEKVELPPQIEEILKKFDI